MNVTPGPTSKHDDGADLVGLDFLDDGSRFTITGTSDNEGTLSLTYIDPLKPLKDGMQHESTVKEVRKWYNKTQLTQAVNNITPSRKSYVNDIAYEAYKQIKTYDVKLSNPFNQTAPTSYKQASNREPQWFSAEDKEKDGIIEFTTWRRLNQATITPEMRRKALRAHHLYNIKREGTAKNRVVANGSRQHPDTYSDTTSPVSSQLMLRLLLVFIAYRNYHTIQMDLTNAYLHAAIKDVVFITIPDGFPGAGEIALLEKGLYGTKQGSRRFYDHTDEVFKSIGLQPCPNEPCLYRYLDEHGACFVLLYVDDALITGNKETVQQVERQISTHFKCKFNPPQDFLGLDINTNVPGHTSLSMTTFTKKMLTALSVTPWPYPILTPGRTDVKIIRGENLEHNDTYRSKVGSLNWLTMGLRMDLVFTTKELSRVLCEPTKEANQILARTMQYVEQTQHARLDFKRDNMLNYTPPKTRKKPHDLVNPYETDAYCLTDGIINDDDKPIKHGYSYTHDIPLILTCLTDIDLGGQLPTRQSTSGYLLYLNGQLFHWRGRTERLIITATAAGEYIALSRGNQASKHVNAVMRFFGNHSPHYHLYTDNQAAEHIATQPNMSEHSRSIDLRHHSIRQDYLDDLMRIGGVSSKDNTSDILTKSLQPDLHTQHTSSLFPDRPRKEKTQENSPAPPTIYHNMVTHAHYHNHLPITPPHTNIASVFNHEAHLMRVTHLKKSHRHNPQVQRDMKSPEQNKQRPKRGKQPFNRKNPPNSNRQHTNRKRQMSTKSGNHSPTQVQQRTTPQQTNQASQSLNAQLTCQNGSNSKGRRVTSTGKELQAHSANKPPIKTCRLCSIPCPISHIEANHRYLLEDLSDWFKRQKRPPTPQISTTTYPSVAPTSRLPTTQHRDQRDFSPKRNHRLSQHDSSTLSHSHQLSSNYQNTTNMLTNTIANACELGPDVPIRPRNPHTRGTPRYTKRQNINRNVRLHLRNDRKIVQEDFTNKLQLQATHFLFYSTLSDFDRWNHTRMVLTHDATLIRQWTAAYRHGKRAILRMNEMMDTPCINMMTRLLVQHVKRALRVAETGTLIRRPSALSWQTPLNQARMDHFCTYLRALMLDPISTPDFTEPILDIANLQCYGDIISDILQDAEEKLSTMN
jgi:hypothetical protein